MAISGTILAYIFSQVSVALMVIIIGLVSPSSNLIDNIDNSPWLNFSITGFASLSILVVVLIFLRLKNDSFKSLGFKKMVLGDVIWLVVGVVIYFILLMAVTSLASLIPGFNIDQSQNVGYNNLAGWQYLLAFAGLVIIPPITEEILFRGFLYRGLASRWPRIIAALFASALFGLVHFQWNVGVDVFVLSLVLIFLLEKTHNLWVCVGLHAAKNLLAFLVLFVFIGR